MSNTFQKDERSMRRVMHAVFKVPPPDPRFEALLAALAAQDRRLARENAHPGLDAA